MALPNQYAAPTANEYGGDEVSALVLDPGSCTIRAGFAGEDTPKSVVPTFYGVIPNEPDLLFGENRIHNPHNGLEIRNPYGEDGLVEDWDTAAKLWEYSITTRLTGPRATPPNRNGLNDRSTKERADAQAAGITDDVEMEETEEMERPLADAPLLMSEPGWNPTKAREKAMEIAMEDWGVPAFWSGRSGVLAAFSAGKASALVIDIGASNTSVTPVSDGMILKKGIMKSSLGGNWISNQIRLMFSQQQPPVSITPHYAVVTKTPVDAGAPSQAILKKFDFTLTNSFRRLEEERVLTEFKESVVQVWEGPGRLSNGTNEDIAKSQPGRPFEMPDGWNQVFGVERYRAVEGLFDAKAAYTDAENPAPQTSQTIPGLIDAALKACDVDLRPILLNNIVVVGSGSLFYGLTRRLNIELDTMFPGPRVRLFAPGNSAERKFAGWIGGSILASLGTFHQMWVSQKEYQEHGSGIVEKRCK
ncbi:Actin/actin-like protein [Rhizodiscina lignyota]|uniref:Actin/actin-like protein n=1 Tax=Rhizodiscina lignyota TaxID=1504668 RepID=A0A9P4IDE3_9PEZI|nr:Actin/actin-like protein [Rhizodiscina lignyota]